MKNTQTVWNPVRDLNELHNRLVGYLGEPTTTDTSTWQPLVDVAEDGTGYRILAELPGMAKEDVKVTFIDGILHLEGERKSPELDEETKSHLNERRYGKFTRSFRLPKDANGEGIDADFKDGILTITVTKREETKPKEIVIN